MEAMVECSNVKLSRQISLSELPFLFVTNDRSNAIASTAELWWGVIKPVVVGLSHSRQRRVKIFAFSSVKSYRIQPQISGTGVADQ